MQLKVQDHNALQRCLLKRTNIKKYGVRIAQSHETKKERTFFLMGLQYLFKPHILDGLSFQHFSLLIL